MKKAILLASVMAAMLGASAAASVGRGNGIAGHGCATCSATAFMASGQRGPVRIDPSKVVTTPIDGLPFKPVHDRLPNCCPEPASITDWSQFFHQGQSSNTQSLLDTYGLEFLPNATMDAQMMGYAQWASTWRPNGWYPNSIHLRAELHELTTQPPGVYGAISSANVASYFASGTNLGHNSLRAWWTSATSGIWDGGNSSYTGPPFWKNTFADLPTPGSILTAPYMRHDKVYIMKLTLELALKDRIKNPDPSWYIIPFTCMERYVVVGTNAKGYKLIPGTPAPKLVVTIKGF